MSIEFYTLTEHVPTADEYPGQKANHRRALPLPPDTAEIAADEIHVAMALSELDAAAAPLAGSR